MHPADLRLATYLIAAPPPQKQKSARDQRAGFFSLSDVNAREDGSFEIAGHPTAEMSKPAQMGRLHLSSQPPGGQRLNPAVVDAKCNETAREMPDKSAGAGAAP